MFIPKKSEDEEDESEDEDDKVSRPSHKKTESTESIPLKRPVELLSDDDDNEEKLFVKKGTESNVGIVHMRDPNCPVYTGLCIDHHKNEAVTSIFRYALLHKKKLIFLKYTYF